MNKTKVNEIQKGYFTSMFSTKKYTVSIKDYLNYYYEYGIDKYYPPTSYKEDEVNYMNVFIRVQNSLPDNLLPQDGIENNQWLLYLTRGDANRCVGFSYEKIGLFS